MRGERKREREKKREREREKIPCIKEKSGGKKCLLSLSLNTNEYYVIIILGDFTLSKSSLLSYAQSVVLFVLSEKR